MKDTNYLKAQLYVGMHKKQKDDRILGKKNIIAPLLLLSFILDMRQWDLVGQVRAPVALVNQ